MTKQGTTWQALIEQMERDGTMDQRREQLRDWFEANPSGTPVQAVAELGFTYPDHMNAVADSIWLDMQRKERS